MRALGSYDTHVVIGFRFASRVQVSKSVFEKGQNFEVFLPARRNRSDDLQTRKLRCACVHWGHTMRTLQSNFDFLRVRKFQIRFVKKSDFLKIFCPRVELVPATCKLENCAAHAFIGATRCARCNRISIFFACASFKFSL